MTTPRDEAVAAETVEGQCEPTPGDSGTARLRRTADGIMSIDLVSAFAGDREMTGPEKALVRRHKEDRGSLFFSDLLYSITHHDFAIEVAQSMWQEILVHKERLFGLLGRDVGITVATLDYLSNITGELQSTTLISEAHVSEIANLAIRDGMTGLFNHATCYELVDLELKNHRRYGTGVCLLVLDIDDFKLINDNAGYQEGDRVIVELARALVEEARDSDICCRLGGDEFVVILHRADDSSEARALAKRIRARSAKITRNGWQVSISVGVALADRETSSARSLLEKADRALREAKSQGKNRVVIGLVR